MSVYPNWGHALWGSPWANLKLITCFWGIQPLLVLPTRSLTPIFLFSFTQMTHMHPLKHKRKIRCTKLCLWVCSAQQLRGEFTVFCSRRDLCSLSSAYHAVLNLSCTLLWPCYLKKRSPDLTVCMWIWRTGVTQHHLRLSLWKWRAVELNARVFSWHFISPVFPTKGITRKGRRKADNKEDLVNILLGD